MKRVFLNCIVAAVLPILVAGCFASESGSGVARGELHEASMNLDLEGVQPFLQRVGSLVEGFSSDQIQTLAGEIGALPIEAERDWAFTVRYRGAEVPLQVHALMDDTDAPDLAFFTTRELAAEIQREMTAFAEEAGI